MRFYSGKKTNPLISILSLLGVRYTSEYANKYFNEHPCRYNLFGLSKMLTYYGVHNRGIKITNKADIRFLELPFVAHIGNDFVAVENVSNDNVCYYWHNNKLKVSLSDFLNMWTGVVLVVESDTVSIEPDYKQHKKEEWINLIPKCLLLSAGTILLGIGFCQSCIYQNLGLILLFILNLLGVYVGFLLVQKQINIHSHVSDKICSLFAQSDCNDVLNSPAAKFMGIIGWSEIGLSYFLSNICVLLFAPDLLAYSVFINILVLPYSFWSVWYQKFRAKAWCPMCIIVQVLLWALFLVNLLWGFVRIPTFSILSILSIGLIYGIPLLLINQLLPYQVIIQRLTNVTQQFNSLKMNEKVFAGLLREQIKYEVDEVPTIEFGNSNAKNTITVFSNPHCEPCARMHKKIEKLLEDTNSNFRIQYILSSFDSILDCSCEFFIFINKRYPKEERDKIYNEWFDYGKYNKENIFKKYSFDVNDKMISDEYKKQLEWKKKTKLRATPTVMFNGYELPAIFFHELDKLIYFADLDITV